MSGSNDLFNVARGRIGYYANDSLGLSPANSRIVIVVLEAVEADDTLNNYTYLGTAGGILAAAGNTEATSTNYARIQLDDTAHTITIDNTSNLAKAIVDSDQTWNSVSQASSEVWVKLLMCYDADNAAGDDGDIIPLTYHSFDVTPNGGNITADFDQTNGWWDST